MAQVRSIGKLIASDMLGGFIVAPVFWYTTGLKEAVIFGGKAIQGRAAALALGVWVRNLFVPMFGQRDVAGKLISFFIRLIQIIFRGLMLVVWIVLVAVGLVVYIIGPVFVVVMLFRAIFT